MTEPTNDLDREERIRRLQARRPAPASPGTRPERGHPAAATRWMLAGLSVASFFTVAGSVAVAGQQAATTPQPVTTPVPAVATAAETPAAAPTAATPAPATSTRTVAPRAHTVTRAS